MPQNQPRLQTGSGRELLRALGQPGSLNWRTHLIFAVPAGVSPFTFDFPRLGGSPYSWALTGIAGFLATVLAIEIFSRLFGKNRWRKPRPALVLTILGLAGLTRGAVISLMGTSIGVIPLSDLTFRILGGPVFVILIYFLANAIVSSRIEYREILSQLLEDQEKLEKSRSGFSAEILRLQNAVKFRIQELIAPSVWELRKLVSEAKLSKDVSVTIGALLGLNESIVRPLSKSLAEPTGRLQELQGMSGQKLERVIFPASVYLGSSLPILSPVLTTFILGLSTRLAQTGFLPALLLALLTSALVLSALVIFTRVTKTLEVSTPIAVAAVVGYGILIGIFTGLLVPLDYLGLTIVYVPQAIAFAVLNFILHFLLQVYQNQRVETVSQLAGVVSALKIVNGQLRQQVWIYQKMISSQLHGRLQAVLQSAAFRLARLESPTPQELEAVLSDVNRAVADLGNFDYLEGSSLSQSLLDLQDVWEGVSQIKYNLDEATQTSLAKDPILARCFIEVLREAVTNAIKHAEAATIWVEAEKLADRLRLSVVNDGHAVADTRRGYGSELIDELTLTRSLGTENGKTIFRAEILFTR
ncbi:hypothetical protein [Candidatus Aquiluna sp. UB-MaderosW2red]|uniref:hypothetical protein n=1 Tax=Candidatus Aquiluna sp. UB-MaderosW2red TaxID=1855377 RepID=UPI000875D520|nr:hypothetical protein [Candidatus Aquiluna sp. UB-MaderosW2red]SCX15522.1 Signal transduction histidine kinase [Candidatus Aquiluna sp. UB-MaderosW2red]